MRKTYLFLLALAAMLCCASGAKADGWPANYQGVMLQGFYWDSYSDTKWTALTSKVDEYSKYFTLIWVPNSAKPASNPSMGYDPVYWFSNHTSAFGNESQLRAMIAAYKAKGVGIIEDVVVNHRSGQTNWYNFPSETWNGKTWKLVDGSICSTDEMWAEGGHGAPAAYKGNPDTGEDFNGSRDLDHTNANVQDHVKNYCKFLIDDMGYVGFRLDMVKGYDGKYTKIYNQYSKPKFCVGEYFDSNYDKCAAWIEATGKESAAFDFPFKYQVNKAFANNDLRELTWSAPDGSWQPAGLVHYGYTQYAVTFIDNHDTYRDGSKFTGDVPAANAFMLCSPGTPCVFLPHYKNYKSEVQALIEVRNQVGVHNLSPVRVLKREANCYMAEVTGTKGKLVVRIGSTSDTPSGYTDSQIKVKGTKYCVWATTQGGVTPTPTPTPGGSYPASLYLMGNADGCGWATNKGVAAKGTNGVYNWSNVTIDNSGDGSGYFAFATQLASSEDDWDTVNSSDRYGATATNAPISKGGSATIRLYAAGVDASGSQSWKIAPGKYSITANLATMTVTVAEAGTVPSAYPATLYMMGHINGYSWATHKGLAATGSNGVYNWKGVTIDDSGDGSGYIAFATLLASTDDDWDTVNSSSRYGATSSDEPISAGKTATIQLYAGQDAGSSQSWKLAVGTYNITADLSKMQISVGNTSGVESLDADCQDAPVEYYNLQGVRVDNPAGGIYIRVQGRSAVKVVIP